VNCLGNPESLTTTTESVMINVMVKKDQNWVISSQAAQEWVEGSTIRSRNPNIQWIVDSKDPRARSILSNQDGDMI